MKLKKNIPATRKNHIDFIGPLFCFICNGCAVSGPFYCYSMNWFRIHYTSFCCLSDSLYVLVAACLATRDLHITCNNHKLRKKHFILKPAPVKNILTKLIDPNGTIRRKCSVIFLSIGLIFKIMIHEWMSSLILRSIYLLTLKRHECTQKFIKKFPETILYLGW